MDFVTLTKPEIMKATIKIYLRNKPDINNNKPVVLRITKDRKTKLISLGFKAKDEEWDSDKNRFNKRSRNYQKKNRVLLNLEDRALKVIEDFTINNNMNFTLKLFEKKFRGENKERKNVNSYLTKLIDDFETTGRYGAAQPYKDLQSSLFKFTSKNLQFKEVDFNFLKSFEFYLRNQNHTEGGIAFKMRHLRALYNNAINEDIVDYSFYPFRKYKISKLKGKSRKIALNKDELNRFINVDLSKNEHLVQAHKLFMFSYYCRGMNWIDMMSLKWEDIYDGKIHYTRKKTKQPFIIEVLDPVKDILDFFKKTHSSTNYVFPILLKENLTPKQVKYRKHKTLRNYNLQLKEIGHLAEIDKQLTSYVARHTYATLLYHEGVSVEKISASMGHSSVLVTMSYLKEFDSHDLDLVNRKLIEEPIELY
ncbi:site-specific integrase [Gramella jeungdoensis]|uniref:Site-specific integrase n=1 Tax=Gramella jeungdoensis TaxID=708091 RepID=A0ABT0Z2D7_9FLAO|nr:site-specific integrase [Gramella jeungdoensis]MCM8569545.1 site-specific integrase [Gramella jeungdoensis]